MEWPRKLSLRRKLTLVIMINTVVALCVAGIGFAQYGLYLLTELRAQDLKAITEILGTNSATALALNDLNAARNTLQSLRAKPHVILAVIYDRDGKVFAAYRRADLDERYPVPPLKNESSRVTSEGILIFQPIVYDHKKIGTMFLETGWAGRRQLVHGYFLVFGLIVVVVSLGAYAMAARLQRPISNPILELAWTTKMVTSSRDYSIRAKKHTEDEIGVLIDGFNVMLDQIQKRDTELRQAREELELRVDERTLELQQEVADRQRAQEALHVSEEQIRLLLDSTAEAIYGVDREGMITFCNPSALRLLGYDKGDDLLGKCAHGMMHHSLEDGTPYPARECRIYIALDRKEGIHWDEEVYWRGDGTSFPVEYWAHPIRKEGEVVGAVITFLDITERKRAEAVLLNAKEAAEAASRAKSEFLANMSHEIRTPMNGIIGMTGLVLDTPLTPEQRDYLGMVKLSAGNLLSVINDILDFSKVEAGKLELEKTEFEIRDLLGNTVKTLALRGDKKNLEMIVRVSPKVPKVLIGDPMRLRQVVVNLAGNALKFTEKGEVILDVELESVNGEEARLHISVSDTGVGIPPEKLGIIFEPFAQADGSTTRRFGGTGLGLTISRGLVELMGGRMWVESESGKGATFHFTCDFQQGNDPAPDQEKIASQSLRGLNVLVVDNRVPNLKICAEMLTSMGMNATLADSSASALRMMEAAKNEGRAFPIVLLDALMPEFDGFQTLQAIRLDRSFAGIVIMMVSVNRQMEDSVRCREFGVKHCLVKPIIQSELLGIILSALGRTGAKGSGKEPSIPGGRRPQGRQFNILLAEDNPVNQRLAMRLLENAGHRVIVAANGREAVAVWENAGASGFDIVLMDIQMPEMDGMEAAAAIREREKKIGKHIPIIALTAHAMRGDKEKYLAAGMDGYVSKPIQLDNMFDEIDRCLAVNERSKTVAETHRESDELIDRVSLLERVEGDQELLAEMIQLFREDAPILLSAMRDALQRGDMEVLERSAHSVKGAAGNLSAKSTAAAAYRLEKDAKNKDAESAKASLAEVERAVNCLLPALAEFCQGVSK